MAERSTVSDPKKAERRVLPQRRAFAIGLQHGVTRGVHRQGEDVAPANDVVLGAEVFGLPEGNAGQRGLANRVRLSTGERVGSAPAKLDQDLIGRVFLGAGALAEQEFLVRRHVSSH